MTRRRTEAELRRTLTGMVVESLAIKQDFAAASVGCGGCGDTLVAGDRVTVTVSCYQDYSWEMEAVYCDDHAVGGVAETMGVRAERQAVVAAVLEATGYMPPRGGFEPDALTLGDVEVLDYSPTDEGY